MSSAAGAVKTGGEEEGREGGAEREGGSDSLLKRRNIKYHDSSSTKKLSAVDSLSAPLAWRRGDMQKGTEEAMFLISLQSAQRTQPAPSVTRSQCREDK